MDAWLMCAQGERLFVGHDSGVLCFFDTGLKSDWGPHLQKGFDMLSTFLTSTKPLHSFASAIRQLQFGAGRLLVCTERHVFVLFISNGQCIQVGPCRRRCCVEIHVVTVE